MRVCEREKIVVVERSGGAVIEGGLGEGVVAQCRWPDKQEANHKLLQRIDVSRTSTTDTIRDGKM